MDFVAVTGKAPSNQEIDFGKMNHLDIITQFNLVRRSLNKELRGTRSFNGGLIVFCDPEFYDSARTNSYNISLTQYSVPDAPRNAFTNQLIAGFEYFNFSNMRFILIDDDRYEIDDKAGLMIPRFSRDDINPLRLVQGPCSRH
ncbi:hypothetical protein [Serratia bockelmannii]|uniref:hypothetical protein n=1 Tax=Serratia bockelmannii TaxID=2703793 RepID=UPI003FA79A7B